MKASTSASATPESATTASSAPTGTVSPSPTTLRRSTPATGLSKTLAILVVSISMISWPAAISAPSSTAQRASTPSSMARPHFGMVIGWMATPLSFGAPFTGAVAQLPMLLRRLLGAVVERAAHRRLDLGDAWDIEILERRRERHRRVRSGHELDRRLQRAERLLRDQAGNVRRHAAARMCLVDHNEPPGLFHRLQDRVGVERRRRARVDDRAGNTLLLQIVGRLV